LALRAQFQRTLFSSLNAQRGQPRFIQLAIPGSKLVNLSTTALHGDIKTDLYHYVLPDIQKTRIVVAVAMHQMGSSTS